MPYTAIGGKVVKDGVEVPNVRKWSAAPTDGAQEYASSSTAGWKGRKSGTRDIKITIDIYADSAREIEASFKLGQDIAALDLYTNATKKYTGPAHVDDINVQTDIETGAIVGATVSLSGNGAWPDFVP